MKYLYAKIPLEWAVKIGVDKSRRHTRTGEVIINESDIHCFGNNEDFPTKIKRMGGIILSNLEAKNELKNKDYELSKR